MTDSTRILRAGITAAAIWLLMLWFNLMTPPMTDNFLFAHDMRPGYAAFMTGSPVHLGEMTVAAAFRQAAEMWHTWCGRFTGNLSVHLFFLLPKGAAAALAAAEFVLYLILLHACIWGRRWREELNASRMAGIAALLWLGVPSFGSAFFWPCVGGSMAMLGQALLLLPFRLALDDAEGGPSAPAGPGGPIPLPEWAACAGFALFGACAASLDYATSAAMPPTAAACTAWLAWRTGRAPRWAVAGTLGVSVGAALTILAPGNAERVRISAEIFQGDLARWLALPPADRLFFWLERLPDALAAQGVPLILAGTAAWLLLRMHGRMHSWTALRRVPPAAVLFLLPAALTHGAYMFTLFPPGRAFSTTAAQIIVAGCILMRAAAAHPDAGRVLRFLKIALFCACWCGVIGSADAARRMHDEIAARDAVIRAHPGGEVTVPALRTPANAHVPLGGEQQDIAADPAFWVNRAVAAHHGLRSIAAEKPEVRLRAAGHEILLRGDHLRVPPELGEIHLYHDGGGLIRHLPPNLAGNLIRRLAEAREGDLRLFLVPILLIRADVRGMERLRPHTRRALFLVRPGGGALSFDLLPPASTMEPEEAS